jgi:hypothetical protein
MSILSDIPEPEYMDQIDIHYLFINQNSSLDKIVTEKHAFEKCSTENFLSKEILLKYIQLKRQPSTSIRYKLKDVLLYLVHLEKDKLQEFVNTSDIKLYSNSFLKILPIIDDISFQPSMYLFHRINGIYIVLEEMQSVKSMKKETLPTSILKKTSPGDPIKKNTKKVRISPDLPSRFSFDKTHKNRTLV